MTYETASTAGVVNEHTLPAQVSWSTLAFVFEIMVQRPMSSVVADVKNQNNA